MSRVPPELINYENQMDVFLEDMRQQNLKNLCAHMRFPLPESESEADRKFIESVEKIRAANRALPKKSIWPGLLALLIVAIGMGYLVFLAVEAF
jgi:hypothetical protein